MNKHMKNMKKHIVLYIALLLMLFAVGCGKDKDSKKETTEKATTQSVFPIDQMMAASKTDAQEDQTTRMDEDGFFLANDYVKTLGDTINVRVEPNTDANIYILLGPDEVVRRTGYNDEWTRVLIDGDSFYIYSDFVVKTTTPVGAEDDFSLATPGDAKGEIIVIDPGNQKNVNANVEEIGPGSEETKQCVSAGFVGNKYGAREYEINLEFALVLKSELELRGYTVYLTREIDDVNISNQARAQVANEVSADAFIKIQMNYSTNSKLTGVMALCMPETSMYNGHLYKQSHDLSTRILQGITEEVDVVNNGIYETDQMTTINWSIVPVSVIKIGYLSNEGEEELLMSYDYQTRVCTGIANGLDFYFGK
ncbi:MAG: N-acetylmuramoyl-L-alanine amidase [Lachnospiraceae bacterium]|nr:N-acetylmuramoyl-L-alanine amidase [Lachnospiraceae bacterium]